METVLRRQKCFDGWIDRQPKYARIENQFVLDHDNVGSVEGACGHRRHQRQRILGYIAEDEPAELSPGKRVEQRGDEAREKTPLLRRNALERSRPAACPVCRK